MPTHLNRRWVYKVGTVMEILDASLREVCLTIFWYRISEGPFEAHEFRPINPSLIRPDAVARHAPHPIHYFGPTNQYLLGITAAKGASTSKQSGISNCYPPTCRAAF